MVRLDVLMSSQRRYSPFVRSLLTPIRTQASEAWVAGDSGNEIRPLWTLFVLLVNPHRACPCCACQARGVAQAKGDAAGCRADAARGLALPMLCLFAVSG